MPTFTKAEETAMNEKPRRGVPGSLGMPACRCQRGCCPICTPKNWIQREPVSGAEIVLTSRELVNPVVQPKSSRWHFVSPDWRTKTLQERRTGVACHRCGGTRWPSADWTPPYLCGRCREVGAGGLVIDEVPTEAQVEARKRAGERLRGYSFLAHGGVGGALTAPDGVQDTPGPQRRLKPCRRHRGCWRAACQVCNLAATENPDDLPPNWKKLSAQVRQRDGQRCRSCGSRDSLSVHHITPRPAGTHDPRNLVTLCESCHNAVERPPETGFLPA